VVGTYFCRQCQQQAKPRIYCPNFSHDATWSLCLTGFRIPIQRSKTHHRTVRGYGRARTDNEHSESKPRRIAMYFWKISLSFTGAPPVGLSLLSAVASCYRYHALRPRAAAVALRAFRKTDPFTRRDVISFHSAVAQPSKRSSRRGNRR